MPESRKGLFRVLSTSIVLGDLPTSAGRLWDFEADTTFLADTHMSQVSTNFLKGAHLVLQARSEV